MRVPLVVRDWSPGPRPSPVFRSVLCDCLSLNVPILSWDLVCYPASLLWSPGPRPSPVFRSVLCDCLSLNVPIPPPTLLVASRSSNFLPVIERGTENCPGPLLIRSSHLGTLRPREFAQSCKKSTFSCKGYLLSPLSSEEYAWIKQMVCACLSRRLVTLHTSRRRRSQNRGASAVAVRHLSYIVLRYD